MRSIKAPGTALLSGILFLVCFLFQIQVTEQGSIFGAPEALYKAGDHVVILNATNIKSSIYGTSNAWVVEFYSSWCGHCINFAPVYKQFAAEVEGWQKVVKVAGIDCADEANIAVCRDYEIMGYPTILFFPPNSPQETIKKPDTDEEKKADEETKKAEVGKLELNRGEHFTRSDKVSQLKHDLMEIVTPHFPHLLAEVPAASTMTTFDSVWKYVRSRDSGTFVTVAVLLFEKEKSYIGKELALRLSTFPEIRVLRFSRKNHLYDKLGIKNEWPAAGYLKPNLQSGIITIPKNKDIVAGLQSSALKLIHSDKGQVAPSKQAAEAAQLALIETGGGEQEEDKKQENNIEEPASASEDIVSLEDLIHAVRNSLRNEVGMHKTIKDSKLKVLKQYVHLLDQLFPADRRELIVFLMRLDKWLDSHPDEVQVNEYMDKLTELEIELHPWDIDVNSWGTCKGTAPGRRGYTCSLWRLFHSLTILATQKSQEVSVLPVVHGYVKEFFGCTECVSHFTKMVKDEGALEISSGRAQALWLWRAHNKVNIRLKGSLSEDPGFPKGLYPSDSQCSLCHTSDGSFNEEKVFEYLVSVYTHPARTLQAVIKNADAHPAEAQALSQNHGGQRSQQPSRFFSGTDYWIFCIVYLSVAALLIFGYIHFKLGSRRRLDPFALCRKVINTSRSIV